MAAINAGSSYWYLSTNKRRFFVSRDSWSGKLDNIRFTLFVEHCREIKDLLELSLEFLNISRVESAAIRKDHQGILIAKAPIGFARLDENRDIDEKLVGSNLFHRRAELRTQ